MDEIPDYGAELDEEVPKPPEDDGIEEIEDVSGSDVDEEEDRMWDGILNHEGMISESSDAGE